MRWIASNFTEYFANTWEFSSLCEKFFALFLMHMSYIVHVVLRSECVARDLQLKSVHLSAYFHLNYLITTQLLQWNQQCISVHRVLLSLYSKFFLNWEYLCSRRNLDNHLKECTTNEGCVCCELIARYSY